jgi:hypothetical protein
LVVSGLNGRLDVDAVGGLQAVAPLVSETLEELDLRRPSVFWELGEEEVTVPEEGSIGWLLNRAWFILMSAPDVDVALTHKVLHLKRPVALSPDRRKDARVAAGRLVGSTGAAKRMGPDPPRACLEPGRIRPARRMVRPGDRGETRVLR